MYVRRFRCFLIKYSNSFMSTTENVLVQLFMADVGPDVDGSYYRENGVDVRTQLLISLVNVRELYDVHEVVRKYWNSKSSSSFWFRETETAGAKSRSEEIVTSSKLCLSFHYPTFFLVSSDRDIDKVFKHVKLC